MQRKVTDIILSLKGESKIDRQDSPHDRYTVLESETVGSDETLTDKHSENLDREPLESKTDLLEPYLFCKRDRCNVPLGDALECDYCECIQTRYVGKS